MKTLLTILTFSFLISCSPSNDTDKTSTQTDTTANSGLIKTDTIKTTLVDVNICDIIYDTITDNNYKFHKWILDILNNKSTHSLDDQMIAMFMSSLNPNETGYYKTLTNKVIYSLLEKRPEKFAYGYNPKLLTNGRYEYFLNNIENPKCNTLPLDTIIKKFENDFPTSDDVKNKKLEILKRLKNAL